MNSPECLTKSLNILSPEENLDNDRNVLKSFRTRLRTFIEGQKWVRRPLMLAPSVCAQYGWKCTSNQLLECDICAAKLSAGQPKVQSYEAYKACMERIRDCLKTAHKKHCPWPLTPCPASYVRMIPIHKEVALKKFKRRLESLTTLENNLPLIKDDVVQKLKLTEEILASLCHLSQVENTKLNLSAVLLAAIGWRREFEGKQKNCLSCYCCQRTVSLLLYKSFASEVVAPSEQSLSPAAKRARIEGVQDENSFQTSEHHELPEGESEPPAKRAKTSEETHNEFDPLFEHRPWCRWVIESEVRENNSTIDELCIMSSIWMPGWKLFMKCLLRNKGYSEGESGVVSSPLKEQLNNARNMLESWSSPS